MSNTIKKLIVLIPSFNDWEALEILLPLIDEVKFTQAVNLEIVIVDDYSTAPIPTSLANQQYHQIQAVNILRLRCNLGHQRAIAVGLCHIYQKLSTDLVIVMDGDGEDNPFEIDNLLNIFDKTDQNKIIFAKRSKRSENFTFKTFYSIYKRIYRLLVGKEISFGNFSLIPYSILKNIVVISGIWNHYSSSIQRSRIPYIEVAIPRARRLAGQPKMNLVSLVTHGLSSIAVYGDVVGTRILMVVVTLLAIALLVLLITIVVKFGTNLAIPGWATNVFGFIILTLFQLVLTGIIFSMIILSTRNSSNFIPIRDYKYFIDSFLSIKS
ncbi:glycosyltransferase [Pseudanabaena yagii]|uniref:Glycosyltransferase n=1 Tax=Pseudanabaena yagii GIHE-NHR1 TaxID=2722753 RepID=A0ABX1LWJ0_9CYAN|nr:glycosyltransferase [Pseudanabaena yagii]NMF60560.1 glycosyltransferase [Pseudanabaena yagii GIHE-NHR1]